MVSSSPAVNTPAAFAVVAEQFLPASACIVETQEGYDVIDSSLACKRGDTLLIWFCGRQQHAYWAGEALITDDGEAIEGEALDGVTVHGLLTYTITRLHDDNSVV